MKKNRFISSLGLALVAVGFVGASWHVWQVTHRAADSGHVHLRLTHDMLHASVRAAFANVIADYHRLHPEVDIDVIEVPSKMFRAWRTTRLVGEDPPDIMRLGTGLSDEELARYFVPLTSWVEQPNPYNRGTPLETTPWKDTFIDGLTSDEAFSKALLEYYGVTLHFSTNRLYCNLDLLRQITGSEKLPTTLDEFFALCATIKAWGEAHGRPLVPVAAYNESSLTLLTPLLRQQTQRLSLAINRDRTLTLSRNQAAVAWLRGEWKVDSPALNDGWQLVRDVSKELNPSFIQAQRDEAGFEFLQQQSVMISSGAFDASEFMDNPYFRCGLFRLATPTPGEGRFGRNVIDAIQETGVGGGAGTFGILRASPHFAEALDFLRYLGSAAVNRKFAATVQRIPAVVGVTIDPRLQTFAPQSEGWPEGITPEFTNWGNREIFRIVFVNLHLLVSPAGGVEEFTRTVAAEFPAALRNDADRALLDTVKRAQRTEGALMADRRVASAGDADAAGKLSRVLELQAVAEGEEAQLRHALATYDRNPTANPGAQPLIAPAESPRTK